MSNTEWITKIKGEIEKLKLIKKEDDLNCEVMYIQGELAALWRTETISSDDYFPLSELLLHTHVSLINTCAC